MADIKITSKSFMAFPKPAAQEKKASLDSLSKKLTDVSKDQAQELVAHIVLLSIATYNGNNAAVEKILPKLTKCINTINGKLMNDTGIDNKFALKICSLVKNRGLFFKYTLPDSVNHLMTEAFPDATTDKIKEAIVKYGTNSGIKETDIVEALKLTETRKTQVENSAYSEIKFTFKQAEELVTQAHQTTEEFNEQLTAAEIELKNLLNNLAQDDDTIALLSFNVETVIRDINMASSPEELEKLSAKVKRYQEVTVKVNDILKQESDVLKNDQDWYANKKRVPEFKLSQADLEQINTAIRTKKEEFTINAQIKQLEEQFFKIKNGTNKNLDKLKQYENIQSELKGLTLPENNSTMKHCVDSLNKLLISEITPLRTIADNYKHLAALCTSLNNIQQQTDGYYKIMGRIELFINLCNEANKVAEHLGKIDADNYIKSVYPELLVSYTRHKTAIEDVKSKINSLEALLIKNDCATIDDFKSAYARIRDKCKLDNLPSESIKYFYTEKLADIDKRYQIKKDKLELISKNLAAIEKDMPAIDNESAQVAQESGSLFQKIPVGIPITTQSRLVTNDPDSPVAGSKYIEVTNPVADEIKKFLSNNTIEKVKKYDQMLTEASRTKNLPLDIQARIKTNSTLVEGVKKNIRESVHKFKADVDKINQNLQKSKSERELIAIAEFEGYSKLLQELERLEDALTGIKFLDPQDQNYKNTVTTAKNEFKLLLDTCTTEELNSSLVKCQSEIEAKKKSVVELFTDYKEKFKKIETQLKKPGERLQDKHMGAFGEELAKIKSALADLEDISENNPDKALLLFRKALVENILTDLKTYNTSLQNASNHLVQISGILKFLEEVNTLLEKPDLTVKDIEEKFGAQSRDIALWQSSFLNDNGAKSLDNLKNCLIKIVTYNDSAQKLKKQATDAQIQEKIKLLNQVCNSVQELQSLLSSVEVAKDANSIVQSAIVTCISEMNKHTKTMRLEDNNETQKKLNQEFLNHYTTFIDHKTKMALINKLLNIVDNRPSESVQIGYDPIHLNKEIETKTLPVLVKMKIYSDFETTSTQKKDNSLPAVIANSDELPANIGGRITSITAHAKSSLNKYMQFDQNFAPLLNAAMPDIFINLYNLVGKNDQLFKDKVSILKNGLEIFNRRIGTDYRHTTGDRRNIKAFIELIFQIKISNLSAKLDSTDPLKILLSMQDKSSGVKDGALVQLLNSGRNNLSDVRGQQYSNEDKNLVVISIFMLNLLADQNELTQEIKNWLNTLSTRDAVSSVAISSGQRALQPLRNIPQNTYALDISETFISKQKHDIVASEKKNSVSFDFGPVISFDSPKGSRQSRMSDMTATV